MDKRKILLVAILLAILSLLAGCNSQTNKTSSTKQDALHFDKDNYTVETMLVQTLQGEVEITYHYYQNIVYVAKPVDKDYQSLDIKVPVKRNGKDISAYSANAPILLANSVGGYLAARNSKIKERGLLAPDEASKPDILPSPLMPNPGENIKKELNKNLALAQGFVVVEPGCRGRDNQTPDGVYYGKAPAAIVDLKAAVRYLRHNAPHIPGNTDWIISTGVSAGGALSALLGSTGNEQQYEPYLEEIGAAKAADHIYASAAFCPITDLEHADMAYEWMFGNSPYKGSLVEQKMSEQLAANFIDYQFSLGLLGKGETGKLTADNYSHYLLEYYLIPAATDYLRNLSEPERNNYLQQNTWLSWNGQTAYFTFADYVKHIGERKKGLPAFDALDLTTGENSLFGSNFINAKHFTLFSLRKVTEEPHAKLEPELLKNIDLMNPLYFLSQKQAAGVAQYWWLRQGGKDTDTSLPVIINLATSLENLGKSVNTYLYWDAGHGADADPEAFINWILEITEYY